MEVAERDGYANDLLHSSLGRGLTLPDRRLATEIVMGVLRWRAQLDYVIEAAAKRPAARIAPIALAALRIGAYQLRYLSRIPANAAVHQSVEMVKLAQPGLAGFVNAVLRHISTDPVSALLATEQSLQRRREVEFSHPAWLLERWSRQFSPSAADRIAEWNNQIPPVAIRLASDPEALPPEIDLAPGRLLASARRVIAGDITKTEVYRRGGIWVQDEASQLIAHLLEPRPNDRILDACAAPGGKAALLHALAPTSHLVAIEPRGHRARLLRRLLADPQIYVVGADATRPLPVSWKFDRILVDAPCTGTGTLARNPEIRWRLQPSDPARVAELQLAILANVSRSLRPGGRMVYSVCSIEPEEGAGVVNSLLRAEPELSVVPAAAALRSLRAQGTLIAPDDGLLAGSFLQILPGTMATDGFFAAILERSSR